MVLQRPVELAGIITTYLRLRASAKRISRHLSNFPPGIKDDFPVADHSEVSPARIISPIRESVLANTDALLESKIRDDALRSITCYFLRGSSAGSTKSIPPGPMN